MITRDKKHDRRWLRTRKAIRNTVVEIMTAKDISDITITEVARKADINRKTFYLHYDGVHAVLNEIENDIVNMMMDIVGKIDLSGNRFNPFPLLSQFNEILNEDLDFYSNLMKAYSGSNLSIKVRDAFKTELLKSAEDNFGINSNLLDISVEYMAAGTLAVYQHWFNTRDGSSLEEISNMIGLIAFSGINGLVEQV